MNNMSNINKKAWSHAAYDFWVKELGEPQAVAKGMIASPEYSIRRHMQFLGDVKDKKIANLLGSCGKKAIPLALLGADVTIVDISEQNRDYALQVASCAGVKINYIVSGLMEWDSKEYADSFDIVYLEGGILHYFSDLGGLAAKIYSLLAPGGRLVLNDFHPVRKLFTEKDIFKSYDGALNVTGNYFDDGLHEDEVAHAKFYPDDVAKDFPKCLLRFWTMGEIITAFAGAGFIIEQLHEGPRFDQYKNIPGEFTLIAGKPSTP